MAALARPVFVAGHAVLPVTRAQPRTLAAMGAEAITAALKHGGMDASEPEALYVGNMMSGMLSHQQHLGPLLASAAALPSVEAATAEACCGAGGAALRWGVMAVGSGLVRTAIVAGVELMTHTSGAQTTKSLATASHWETEGALGETFVTLNGKLMDLYLRKYHAHHSQFAPFAINAHNNAAGAGHAVFRKTITEADFENAKAIAGPIKLFDASPTCDGAAAVVLTSDPDIARRAGPLLQITGSGAATDRLAIADRPEPLRLLAVERSAKMALQQSGLQHKDIDIFELHDAYTIMACLSLESAGFVPPGQGLDFAKAGGIARGGAVPMATFGGLKARGHPVGATGVYQLAEMALQLRHLAGWNQVDGAKRAMVQNIGGSGASVFAHVVERVE
eukprot:m.69929 g.69929  ORF g.69929 m.69929 type:complete len:392 (+) comp7567_c0_seq2:53-1228(+)